MVNSELFELYRKNAGLTKGYLASKCGIQQQTLKNKIENRTSFLVSEVFVICQEFGIHEMNDMKEVFYSEVRT